MTAAYRRAYRARKPAVRAKERAAQRARGRALTRLADLHGVEFLELFNEERANEGLPPVGALPIGRPPKNRSEA